MANTGFNPEDMKDYEARWASVLALQNKASDGLKGYNSILKEINEAARNLKHIKKQEIAIEKELKENTKKGKLY